MKCEQIRDMLSPYMDGMTSEKENKLIEAHLAACVSCRQELEKMQFISACLSKIEAPPCPEGLAADVRKRILEEQNKVFSLREATKPKKQGWIAAGIAGIALFIGIFINSILPVENIAFLWQDKENDPDKNVAVIEEKEPLGLFVNMEAIPKDGKNVAEVQKNESFPEKDNRVADIKDTVNTPVKPEATEKKSISVPWVTEQLAAQIKVNDINKSAQEVVKLAQANQADYKVVDNIMQPLSAGATKAIELLVDKDKADVIMEQLSYIGEVSSTSRNQVELTEQYNKIQEEIDVLNEKMVQAEKKGDAAVQADLEERIRELNQMKGDLEKQKDKITLKVYLVENLEP